MAAKGEERTEARHRRRTIPRYQRFDRSKDFFDRVIPDSHQAGSDETLVTVVGGDEDTVVELIDLERKNRPVGIVVRYRELVPVAALAAQQGRQTHRLDESDGRSSCQRCRPSTLPAPPRIRGG